ncbi:MAG: sporulation integral membrane protein YtvI [Clostridia bacterium]|nr:sporulation integral membrane protein YtvI [Clostridia bacterium]
MNNEKKKKFLIYLAYYAVIIGLFYFAMRFCLNSLLPFVIGTFIAIAVQKPSLVLSERIRLKHSTVALISVLFIYLIILLILFLVGSKIYYSAATLYDKMPDLVNKINQITETAFNKAEGLIKALPHSAREYLTEGVKSFLPTIGEKIADYVGSLVASAVSGAPAFLVSLLVTVVSGCYIAKDFDAFKRIVGYALREEQLKKLSRVKRIAVSNTVKILKSYFLLSFSAFIILFTGLLILRVDGAAKKALIISLIDVLPVVGSGTVLLPWAIISLLNGEKLLCVGLIVILALVTVTRNVLEPKIMGKEVGLHPLLTLFSLFLGLKLFGVLGMFVLPLIVTVAYKYTEERVTGEEGLHSM